MPFDEETLNTIRAAQSAMSGSNGMQQDPENARFAEMMERRNMKIREQRTRNAAPAMGSNESVADAPVIAKQKRHKPRTAAAAAFEDAERETVQKKGKTRTVADLTPEATFGEPKPLDEVASKMNDVADSDVSDAMRALYGMNTAQKPITPAPETVKPASAAEPSPAPEPPRQVQRRDNPLRVGEEVKHYESFSELTGLPSRGLFYEDKLYGQALKLEDMITLGSIDEDNYVESLDEILSRRIRGVSPDDILTCDEVYIMQWLRASSFPDTPIPHPGFTCPMCEFEMKDPTYGFNFGRMKFTLNEDLEDILRKHADGYHRIQLSDGRDCDIYLHRRAHDTAAMAELARYERQHGKEAPASYARLAAVAAMVEITGLRTMEEKIKYFGSMDIKPAMSLFDEINASGLTTNIAVTHICPACGGSVETPYSFQFGSFIPDL